MKAALYLCSSILFLGIGSLLLRYALQPPYIANTFQLLQLEASAIETPLPRDPPAATPQSKSVAFLKDGRVAYLGVVCLMGGGLLLYFFPFFIGRHHRERLSILILIFFVGWSFLGWVIALIWAVTKDPVFLVEPSALAAQLKELGELRKKGVLDNNEFQKLKSQLISKYTTTEPSAAQRRLAVRNCPHCGREYKIRPILIGKTAVCNDCRKRFKL